MLLFSSYSAFFMPFSFCHFVWGLRHLVYGDGGCLGSYSKGISSIPNAFKDWLIQELLIYFRPLCWLEHMSLDNETGLDPAGVRVRPVNGLVAADYFVPGYFVWAVLIANLARIGYEEKTMYMAAYDWRLSFQNTEVLFISFPGTIYNYGFN